MKKNGYVNFNFLDSKSNINDILVGLDLDYSNKVIAPDGHELALIAFIPIENLLTIAPQFKTDFQGKEYKDKAIYVFSYYDKEDYFLDYITEIDQEGDDFLEKYIFIGQILGMDLPKEVNEIFYLTENIGYIFINRDLSGGLFFVQTT